MELIKKIVTISRYRFWSYTAGPYLLGFLLGSPVLTQSIISPNFITGLLYFLIPANVFIYGINDYFDRDTDKYNSKKGTKEFRLTTSENKFLLILLIVSFFLTSAYFLFISNYIAKLTFLLFIFLSYFYSAKPFRFKSKPFIDSISNVLYILPGITGYIQSAQSFPPVLPLIGFWCWAAAMHLFSAIPDITSDKKANLKTTAVVLGANRSLLLCSILWLVFVFITIYFFRNSLLIGLLIYPALPLLALLNSGIKTTQVYWYFPYINLVSGFLSFILILTTRGYA